MEPKEKTVFLAEDDESMAELLKLLIQREGFRLQEARDGREALSRMLASPPDLVLLDLMLPGLGGYEIVRELQAQGLGQVPVVILTARNMDRKAVALVRMEANVREFLQKPPRAESLMATLHKHLGTRPATTAPS